MAVRLQLHTQWCDKEQAEELRLSGLAPSSKMKATPYTALADAKIPAQLGSTLGGSGIGLSASEAGGGSVASSQLSDISRAITEMQASLSGMTTRLEQVEKKKQTACFNCGSTDHTLKDCTEEIKARWKKMYDNLHK